MSDLVRAVGRKSDAASLAAGLASCLLFLSLVLSFAFLLPVQIAYGRLGRRAGGLAAGVAAAGIAAVQGWRLASTGASDPLALIVGMLPPFVLLGALVLLNAPIWSGLATAYRVAIVVAGCALSAIPLLITLEGDVSFRNFLEKLFGDFLTPLRSALGDGYDASALAASLNPPDVVASLLEMLRNSYAAVFLVYLGGSWRLGNRLSGPGSRGREETVAIDELRLNRTSWRCHDRRYRFLLSLASFISTANQLHGRATANVSTSIVRTELEPPSKDQRHQPPSSITASTNPTPATAARTA